jgi:hypothetical protein
MRNQIDIDEATSRAIIREIGERLRASLKEDELPAKLRVQLDSLDQSVDFPPLSCGVLPRNL